MGTTNTCSSLRRTKQPKRDQTVQHQSNQQRMKHQRTSSNQLVSTNSKSNQQTPTQGISNPAMVEVQEPDRSQQFNQTTNGEAGNQGSVIVVRIILYVTSTERTRQSSKVSTHNNEAIVRSKSMWRGGEEPEAEAGTCKVPRGFTNKFTTRLNNINRDTVGLTKHVTILSY